MEKCAIGNTLMSMYLYSFKVWQGKWQSKSVLKISFKHFDSRNLLQTMVGTYIYYKAKHLQWKCAQQIARTTTFFLIWGLGQQIIIMIHHSIQIHIIYLFASCHTCATRSSFLQILWYLVNCVLSFILQMLLLQPYKQ